MLKSNSMKEKMDRGEKVIGAFSCLGSPAVIEIMGQLGMNFVIFDNEHCSGDDTATENLIRTALLRDLLPIVRVKQLDRSSILKTLDMGAMGIMVPFIKTVDDVKQFIQFAKYRPVGDRGCGLGRVSCFGFEPLVANHIMDYFEWANSNTLTIAQCETVECVENIEEILQVEGLDGMFIGMFDLSVSMNMPKKFTDPKFIEATEKVRIACKNAGKFCIGLGMDAVSAKKQLVLGYDAVATTDSQLFGNGINEYLVYTGY